MAHGQESKKGVTLFFFTKLLFAVLIFIKIYGNCYGLTDPDLGWHLIIGEQILETGSVPEKDNLSFTMSGHEWVDHEWLLDALMALASRSDNWNLVIIFFSIVSFLPFAYWLKKAKHYSEIIPILAGAILMSFFISVRPQMITFLFFFIIFELTRRSYLHDRSLLHGKNKYILPGLFLAWANLHAGFFSGIILILSYISIRVLLQKMGWEKKYIFLKNDLFCLAVCSLIPLINPYGLGLYQEIFKASTSPLALKYITEWVPIYKSETIAENFYYIAIFLVTPFLFTKKVRAHELATSLFFLAMGVKSARMLPFFIASSMPYVSHGMRDFSYVLKKSPHFHQKKQVIIRVAIFVTITTFLSLSLFGLFYKKNYVKIYPTNEAFHFLKKYSQDHENVRIFNHYTWGGMISYQIPEMRLFIDGRMPHWKNSETSAMKDYVEARYEDNWQEIFEKWKINLVFLPKEVRGNNETLLRKMSELVTSKEAEKIKKPLYMKLIESDWKIIYEDSDSIILEK